MEPIALPYYTSHKTVQAGKIVEIRPLQTAPAVHPCGGRSPLSAIQ